MSNVPMTKKEKKQLRKQMMQRKQELLAKHAPGRKAGDSGGFRSFSDVKPKLPTYTPPTKASGHSRPKPVIKAVTPPKPAAARKPRVISTTPAISSTPATYSATAYETPAPAVIGTDTYAQQGPGILQRTAARLERLGSLVGSWLGAALRWRPHVPRIPWHRMTADATAPGFGTLGTIVWPLRCCGLVAVGGAVKLALEAHSRGASLVASALVLGMGVAVAVMILAMAEIARAMKHIAQGVV